MPSGSATCGGLTGCGKAMSLVAHQGTHIEYSYVDSPRHNANSLSIWMAGIEDMENMMEPSTHPCGSSLRVLKS